MNGDDDSFLIKNMEASESALLNSGKGHVDPEIFKRWRMKKCWTQYDISSSQEKTTIDR